MNKQKFMKWALPALLMSGMVFEIMPGSVSYYAKDAAENAEAAWNFFSVPVEGMAASCLPVAGVVTFAALLLALAAAFFHKEQFYRIIGWLCLAAGALASAPYLMRPTDEFLQPNVVILLILTASWLLAMALDKRKAQAETDTLGSRL